MRPCCNSAVMCRTFMGVSSDQWKNGAAAVGTHTLTSVDISSSLPVSSNTFFSQLWWQLLFIAVLLQSYTFHCTLIYNLKWLNQPPFPGSVTVNKCYFSLWKLPTPDSLTNQAYHWIHHWRRKNRDGFVVMIYFTDAAGFQRLRWKI